MRPGSILAMESLIVDTRADTAIASHRQGRLAVRICSSCQSDTV